MTIGPTLFLQNSDIMDCGILHTSSKSAAADVTIDERTETDVTLPVESADDELFRDDVANLLDDALDDFNLQVREISNFN